MRTAELLNDLQTRGVILFPTPEGIRYEAPRGVMTPTLRAALAAHKGELLKLLAKPDLTIPERFTDADCLALIHETFEAVATDYVDGALALIGTDPDLSRRFHETEAAIETTVKTRATEREVRAVLAAHVAVIREACQRRRAQYEAAAD